MRWFNNLKIKSKLVSGFIIVAIFTGVVGFIGITNMNAQNKSAEGIFRDNFLPSQELAKVEKNLMIIRTNYVLMLYEKSADKLTQRVNDIDQLTVDINKSLNNYEAAITTKENRDLFDALKQDLAAYVNARTEGVNQIKAGKLNDAIIGLPAASKTREKVEQDVQGLTALNIKMAEDSNKENSKEFKTQSTIMIAIIIAGASLAIALGFILASIIGKSLNKLVIVANKIADGDLDVNIDINSKDEVGILASSFRKMSNNINEVMSNISNASEQVASGSKQVSDSSMELSQGATEQASSIEQLTASIEEIASQTKLNADNANEANELAEIAKNNAVQGNSHMKEMLRAMEEINESSSSISKIIKVIDEIAFQTNILALNAAVEAARAGQHGKGFAVVAEEVRNLAARSANAAKETTDMIEGSIKKVEGGTKIATETAEALNKIVEGVAKVASIVGDIATASNEQATGVSQINQGIMQVSEVVQTNSATSEESAAASEELSSQAELLRDQVAKFKLKKTNYVSHSGMDELSPEVLRMLENMSNNKRKYSQVIDSESYQEAAATISRSKNIALSDKEFGKY
jgi:methyl-accepting chemotaxis protein